MREVYIHLVTDKGNRSILIGSFKDNEYIDIELQERNKLNYKKINSNDIKTIKIDTNIYAVVGLEYKNKNFEVVKVTNEMEHFFTVLELLDLFNINNINVLINVHNIKNIFVNNNINFVSELRNYQSVLLILSDLRYRVIRREANKQIVFIDKRNSDKILNVLFYSTNSLEINFAKERIFFMSRFVTVYGKKTDDISAILYKFGNQIIKEAFAENNTITTKRSIDKKIIKPPEFKVIKENPKIIHQQNNKHAKILAPKEQIQIPANTADDQINIKQLVLQRVKSENMIIDTANDKQTKVGKELDFLEDHTFRKRGTIIFGGISLFTKTFKEKLMRYGGLTNLINRGKIIHYDELRKYFSGKSVCVVGPAEYIMYEFDHEYGKYIDSHDIVVKLNGMVSFNFSKRDIGKYYGKKINVVYTTLCNDRHDADTIASCYRNIDKKTIIVFRSFGWDDKIYDALMENDNIILCYYGRHQLNELSGRLRNFASTGFIAVYECIEMAKSKYITGLTLGHPDPIYADYIEEYHPDGNQITNMRNKKGYWGSHNMSEEERFFIELYNSKLYNIKVDSYLKNLLSLK